MVVADSLAVDEFRNLHLAGDFLNSADFDPGPAVFSMASAGSSDAFVVKLNSQGRLLPSVDNDNDGDGVPDDLEPPQCRGERTVLDRNSDGCDDLVEEAIDRVLALRVVIGEDGPLGYYEQVLNLACVATRSPRDLCSRMQTYYGQVAPEWPPADGMVAEVLRNILHPDGENIYFSAALIDIGTEAAFLKYPLLRRILLEEGADRGDFATLVAGGVHFVTELGPGFHDYISAAIADADRADLAAVIEELRIEHDALIENAVVPGFVALGQVGIISPIPAEYAAGGVPPAARALRESIFGSGCGRSS